eukprot:CAMPEP_0113496924 /NCGR_PEP_ID=MMETSP0014_2-20120614/30368_1 /TAXON_ID=2857 /ORGANISM="Nitzschia sp." /LENGTH=322 /DNA_ID=CAMNT_0000390853 /DNA_START=347 /DNA_END=1315 /DNA_ORIENTATION=- /assembly_acc=CAM_ASM_000159
MLNSLGQKVSHSEDAQSVGSILLSLKRDSPVLGPTSTSSSPSALNTSSPSASSKMASSTSQIPNVVSTMSLDGTTDSSRNEKKKRRSEPPQSPRPSQSIVTTTATTSASQNHEEEQHPVRKRRKLAMMKVLAAKGVAKKYIIRPSDYARTVFKSNGFPHLSQTIESDLQRCGAFTSPPTAEMMASYTQDVLNMARQNDLDGLRTAHGNGQKLHCCNSFGESLLHGACRRGQTSIVKFLIEEVKVDILSVRDDYQRTVLHDAFWTAEPNFEIVEMLLKKAPELLLLQDVRGFTPLDYVPTESYHMWLRFLWERKAMLRPKVVA